MPLRNPLELFDRNSGAKFLMSAPKPKQRYVRSEERKWLRLNGASVLPSGADIVSWTDQAGKCWEQIMTDLTRTNPHAACADFRNSAAAIFRSAMKRWYSRVLWAASGSRNRWDGCTVTSASMPLSRSIRRPRFLLIGVIFPNTLCAADL